MLILTHKRGEKEGRNTPREIEENLREVKGHVLKGIERTKDELLGEEESIKGTCSYPRMALVGN